VDLPDDHFLPPSLPPQHLDLELLPFLLLLPSPHFSLLFLSLPSSLPPPWVHQAGIPLLNLPGVEGDEDGGEGLVHGLSGGGREEGVQQRVGYLGF
jgi:hypothetical protein